MGRRRGRPERTLESSLLSIQLQHPRKGNRKQGGNWGISGVHAGKGRRAAGG